MGRSRIAIYTLVQLLWMYRVAARASLGPFHRNQNSFA